MNNNDGASHGKSKSTKGRQKIEIKKLQDKNSLQVTFSKRRTGLFSKAMELSVLCGAEVAMIVFSPHGKTHLLGHPSFESVLKRFLDENDSSCRDNHHHHQETVNNSAASFIPYVQEHNTQYENTLKELEKEKVRAKMIEEENKVNKNMGIDWWEQSVDNMSLEEAEEFEKALQTLRTTVAEKVNDRMMNEYLVSDVVNHDHNHELLGMNGSVNDNLDRLLGGDSGFDFGQHI